MFCSAPVNGGLIYSLMNVGYTHTIISNCSLAAVGLCIRCTFLPKEPPTQIPSYQPA